MASAPDLCVPDLWVPRPENADRIDSSHEPHGESTLEGCRGSFEENKAHPNLCTSHGTESTDGKEVPRGQQKMLETYARAQRCPAPVSPSPVCQNKTDDTYCVRDCPQPLGIHILLYQAKRRKLQTACRIDLAEKNGSTPDIHGRSNECTRSCLTCWTW